MEPLAKETLVEGVQGGKNPVVGDEEENGRKVGRQAGGQVERGASDEIALGHGMLLLLERAGDGKALDQRARRRGEASGPKPEWRP